MIPQRERKFWALIYYLNEYFSEAGKKTPEWLDRLGELEQAKQFDDNFSYCDYWAEKVDAGHKDRECGYCPLNDPKFGSDRNAMDGCDRKNHPIKKYIKNQNVKNVKAVLKLIKNIPVPKSNRPEGLIKKLIDIVKKKAKNFF